MFYLLSIVFIIYLHLFLVTNLNVLLVAVVMNYYILNVIVNTEHIIHVVCRGLTDESEILKFLQHGTLVGLLPVPHPILIRKYQSNPGTTAWFRTYMWAVIFLRY